MVWIHGGKIKLSKIEFIFTKTQKTGGFLSGGIFNGLYDGRYLAESGKVVVVSIAYRLGVFGFLYGNSPDAPGNLGLRDQILALQWVQENIAYFGGDPKKVFVFVIKKFMVILIKNVTQFR